MVIVPGAAGESGALARAARLAPLGAPRKAGSARIRLGANEVLEFATGPGFFKVELDRALALVDDAVNVKEIDDSRAQAQADAGAAEDERGRERVGGAAPAAARGQLEQRIRHAENQLSVSGRTTG